MIFDKVEIIDKKNPLFEEIYKLRYEVFVIEQGISIEDEFDSTDNDKSLYFIGYKDDKAIACIRLEEDAPQIARIERVTIKKHYRSNGFGKEIMGIVIKHIVTQKTYKVIKIKSQLQASGFYGKLGFMINGEIEIVAGIPHIEMTMYLF